jgi:hypothetical protein
VPLHEVGELGDVREGVLAGQSQRLGGGCHGQRMTDPAILPLRFRICMVMMGESSRTPHRERQLVA